MRILRRRHLTTSLPESLEPETTRLPDESERAPFVLRDPWPWAEPIRLEGWAERERVNPLVMAISAAVATWVLFFLVVNVATVLMLLNQIQEVGLGAVDEVMAQNPNIVLGANALGQVVGLLMLTIAITRLHTLDVFQYLRVRRTDPTFYVLAGAGLLALMPFVSWIGEYARRLPYPDFIWRMEEAQRALLERIFAAELHLGLALLFVAVTPAICEEIIFRGYLQRNVERRLGAAASIVIVGILFGIFHVRFTEFIPLVILGCYLGYVVWVSGSLWVGVLGHLLNNGAAVLVSHYAQSRPEPVPLDEIAVPWYFALAGLGVATGLILAMRRRRELHLASAPARAPDPSTRF